MTRIITIILFLASLIVPVSLWWLASDSSPSFVSYSQTLKSLGQIFGLVGTSLLSINIILSSRSRIIENLLGGLNRVFINHHVIGTYAFILILFHPLLLSFQYLNISVEASARFFLVPLSDYPTWFGICANILFIVLLILTLYVNLPYELWKKTHKFLGLVQFLALLHIATIPGNLTGNMPLRYYMVSISTLGVIFFLYNSILGRFLTPKYKYKVLSLKQAAADIWEINLQPVDQQIRFFSGQFIFVTPIDSPDVKKEQHPFSISSPNNTELLSFTAKALGDFTRSLKYLKPGTDVKVEGAYGKFIFTQKRKKQIWIAGGVGITPFMSLVRQMGDYQDFDFELFYTIKNDSEAAFVNEIKITAKNQLHLKYHQVNTAIEGRLTADKIAQLVPDFKKRTVFLCGPPQMMKSIRSQFNKLGLRHSQIISEEFSLY